MVNEKVDISVGIFAYNEEKNIKRMINSLYSQKQKSFKIDEVYVFSSGSTDKTNKIVESIARKYKSLNLISKPERKGKSADVNEFLSIAKNEILAISSADIILDKYCLEYLVRPLLNYEKVGLTQPKIIPKNNINTFIGYTVNLQWNVSNYINTFIKNARTGELNVLRNIIDEIPNDIVNDDAYIEFLIREKGFKCIFVDKAIIYNKGPENIKDFIKQRRRIYAGFLDLKNRTGYKPETIRLSTLIRAFVKFFPIKEPERCLWYFGAIGLEMYARFLGMWDYYIKKKNHTIWDSAESTKKLEV